MKVVLLAENWPPRIGGIENYLHNIASHLPAGSVTVVAPSGRAAGEVAESGKGIKEVTRKRFFWPVIKPAWLPLFISLYRGAKREKIDIMLCGKALFEGQVGYYLKKYLNVPYVVYTYAMELETWRGNRRQRRALERVLHSADRVVYINDVTKTSLLELGVQEHQLVKIWPGVDDQYFKELPADAIEEVKRRYGLKSPYLFCLSRLIPRKGVDVLIEGFSQIDQTKYADVSLIIAGDGPEKELLQEHATQNIIERSVKFLGYVPTADLPALYQGAEFFILTPTAKRYDFEGFGIVYIEAAASGKTAIGTSTGGVVGAVVHNATGLLVQPESPRSIKEALEYLMDNKPERDRLAAAAKDRAVKEFRWPKRVLLVKGMIDAILLNTTKKSSVAK